MWFEPWFEAVDVDPDTELLVKSDAALLQDHPGALRCSVCLGFSSQISCWRRKKLFCEMRRWGDWVQYDAKARVGSFFLRHEDAAEECQSRRNKRNQRTRIQIT